jgi:hypothetical protein
VLFWPLKKKIFCCLCDCFVGCKCDHRAAFNQDKDDAPKRPPMSPEMEREFEIFFNGINDYIDELESNAKEDKVDASNDSDDDDEYAMQMRP